MSVSSRNHYIGSKNQIPTCPQSDNLQKTTGSCQTMSSIYIKSIILTIKIVRAKECNPKARYKLKKPRWASTMSERTDHACSMGMPSKKHYIGPGIRHQPILCGALQRHSDLYPLLKCCISDPTFSQYGQWSQTSKLSLFLLLSMA